MTCHNGYYQYHQEVYRSSNNPKFKKVQLLVIAWGGLWNITSNIRLQNSISHKAFHFSADIFMISLISWFSYLQYSMIALKRKSNHFDEIFIAGCTGSCHFDNFQCSQWWKFCQNDKIFVSVSVRTHTWYSMITFTVPIFVYFNYCLQKISTHFLDKYT